MSWWNIKVWLMQNTGLHMDALHVHAGVLGQILVALIIRRTLASPIPWLALLAAALLNEYYDLSHEIWPDRGYQYEESFRDVWNTMLVPTLLLLLVRFVPSLFVERRREPAEPRLEAASESAA